MIDGPHGFILHTTETPRPEKRRRATPPTLTVTRGPRDAGRAGVTLEPLEDEGGSAFLAERRATYIQKRTERFAEYEREILADCAERVNDAVRCHKHGPIAGRAERIAKDREGWPAFAMETIDRARADMIEDTTARPILAVRDPETREPGVYVNAFPGLGMAATVVEPQGQTVVVRVAGDPELQERVYSFLVDLRLERAVIREMTS